MIGHLNRFTASAMHLGLSLLVFAFLAYVILTYWYPDFFFQTDGGWRGMRIIIFVDLVLGPALTLIVFKAGKPGLRSDLTIIGVVQLACLIAGTYIVYSERPLAIVYNDSRFSVVSKDDFHEAGIEVPLLSDYPGRGPKWVMIEIPTDLNEEADFRSKYFKAGRALNTVAEHYQPFDFEHPQVKDASTDIKNVRFNEERSKALDKWLEEVGGSIDDYFFYNISSRFTYGFLALRKTDGTIAGLIDL